MKLWWEGIRAWWLRRFRGFVAAPKLHGGRGTSWQEHKRYDIGFTCSGKLPNGQTCGQVLAFLSSDLVIREQEHREDCDALLVAPIQIGATVTNQSPLQIEPILRNEGGGVSTKRCNCPITDARHVKICPACGLGHWNDATPRLIDKSVDNEKRKPA